MEKEIRTEEPPAPCLLQKIDATLSFAAMETEPTVQQEVEAKVEALESCIAGIKIEETSGSEPLKTDLDEKPEEDQSSPKEIDKSEDDSPREDLLETEPEQKSNEASQDEDTMEIDDHEELPLDESQIIRRSRRIKKISSKKKRSVGHGLVQKQDFKVTEEKVDIEMPAPPREITLEEAQYEKETEERLKKFITIKENAYKCDRNVSKEAKKMLCDCFLTEEEYGRGELGCGEDCLNRLLMIECGPKCNIGDRCTNKRFQNAQYASCRVFRTEMKGFGIQAAGPIEAGEFIMEYVGEVLDSEQFEKRAAEYSKKENKHYYFMALRSDAVIDATTRGNISRFINHSCDPNAETQKWTVNGELRIGFFSTKDITPGEEITFDYQFQRYGLVKRNLIFDSFFLSVSLSE